MTHTANGSRNVLWQKTTADERGSAVPNVTILERTVNGQPGTTVPVRDLETG
jgi:hypothetical protein